MSEDQVEIFDISSGIEALVTALNSAPDSSKNAPAIEPNFLINCYTTFGEYFTDFKNIAPISTRSIFNYLKRNIDSLNNTNAFFDSSEAILLMNNLSAELRINNQGDKYTNISSFYLALSTTELRGSFQRLKTEHDIAFTHELLSHYRPQNQIDKVDQLAADVSRTTDAVGLARTMVEELNNEAFAIGEKLRSLSNGAGFVELNSGFESLKSSKSDELKSKIIAKRWITGFMFFAIACELLVILTINPGEAALAHSLIGLPIFTALLLLLYFFRLTYREEDAIRAQILQIDLRMSLIRFFKSYSDHANEIRDKDKRGTELEKFESIIFSNIAPNQEKMPGAFDGVDDLIKLLKASK